MTQWLGLKCLYSQQQSWQFLTSMKDVLQTTNQKLTDSATLDFGKMSITLDWIDICIKFYGIMHWTLAYTTACTTVQAVIMACTSCSHSLRLDALGICALWAQCRLNLCIIQFDEWFQSVLVSFSIKSEAFSREVSLCWQWSNNEVDEVFSDHQQFFSYDQISGNSTKPL